MDNVGPKIKILIDAELGALQQKLKTAGVSMENLSKAEQEAAVNAAILARQNKNLADSYAKVQKGSGAAAVTFMEFNRIVQDAPFGMLGVGNNIQQLSANFGLLQGQVGGVKNALSAFFTSITTGINPYILAVSAITSLWTMYKQGVFDAKEETDDFNTVLQKFIETLSDVNSAKLKGLQDSAKETRTFQDLKLQAENANIPLKDRLEAVRDLQEKYPDYLGNLTQEQILTGKVGTAYEELTKNIVANAKARAFSEKIGENSIKIFEIEERRLETANKLLKAQDDLAKAKANDKSAGAILAGQTTTVSLDVVRAQEIVNDLIETQVLDSKEIIKLQEANVALTSQISTEIQNGARFTEEQKEKVDGLSDAYKKAFAEFSKLQDEVNRVFFLEGRSAYEQFKRELQEANALQDRLVAKSKELITGFTSFDDLSNKILRDLGGPPTKETAEVYDPTEELKQVAKQAALTEAAFDGLARATSRALGSGNEWGRFASDFLKFAGEIIATNFAISKSNVITGATSAGAAAGPLAPLVTPALITQGLALIGSLFAAIMGGGGSSGSSATSKSYGKPPGRRHGGFISAGLDYIVGENRPEIFRSSFSGQIFPSYEDYASNTRKSKSKDSAAIKVDVEVHGVIDGDVIRVTNKRSERRVNKT